MLTKRNAIMKNVTLFTKEQVEVIVAEFCKTYNTSSLITGEESVPEIIDVIKNLIPYNITPLNQYLEADDVYIEDCELPDGRYTKVLIQSITSTSL
jgi:hypothetical protein